MGKQAWRNFSVRLPVELVALLDDAAAQELRTRNNLVWNILKDWLIDRQTPGEEVRYEEEPAHVGAE